MFSFVLSIIPNLYYLGIDTVPGPGKFHIWVQNSALRELFSSAVQQAVWKINQFSENLKSKELILDT